MKRFLALFLALVMLTALLSSCRTIGGDEQITTAATTTETPTTETPTTSVPAVSELNGVGLEMFSIVYSEEDYDYSKRAAEYIKSEILARTELDLPLITDTAAPTEYEIVVGETSREISARLDADTKNVEFAILAEEHQIALEGDYFIIAAAAYFFVNTYVPADDFSAVIPSGVSIHEPIQEKAENFILLIGDGMGVNQTRIFEKMNNTLPFGDGENIFYGYYLPNQGFSRTDSLSGTTDSAAGGTALSSGLKTINYYVGQDKNHQTVQSITELASTLGKSTAVMSTEDSTGATPAAFSAHANDRTDYDEILADQAALTAQYGTIVNCGLGDVYDVTEIEAAVTSTLDALDDNENGFFLMYEEAYIDKHCHSNMLPKTFYAVVRFNQVIALFMEYAFYNPNTFVLITADHETGGLTDNFKYTIGDHTSANVPVFAYGDGSELFAGKTVENIQIPQTIASFMGVDNFGDQTTYKPLKKD